MMSLPSELEDLERQYQDLYERVQAGVLDQNEALGLLDALTAVDGQGATWKINPSAEGFLRARPGEGFTPTDPNLFAPLTYPSPAAATLPPAPTPWNDDPFNQTSAGFPGFPTDPNGFPPNTPGFPPNTPGFPPAGFGNDPAAPWGGTAPANPAAKEKKKRSLPKVGLPGGVGARWSSLTPGRKRLLVVVTVCLAVLAFVALRPAESTSDGAAPSPAVPSNPIIPPPSNDPSASPEPSPSGEPEPTPEPSPSGEPEPTPTPKPEPKPDRPNAAAGVKMLTSGDRGDIAKYLGVPNGPSLALQAALWAGLDNAGLSVDVGPLKGVSQTWTVVDSSGKPVARATVKWEKADGGWRPTGWPVLQPVKR